MTKVASIFDGRTKIQSSLGARYGEIGISAVVAAMRYRPSATPKNPAYAEMIGTDKPAQDEAA
jgi:hypothetical protein